MFIGNAMSRGLEKGGSLYLCERGEGKFLPHNPLF
jgi:hypothetical protein